jgi:hypothetical protein
MQFDESDRQFDSTELYMTCCMPKSAEADLEYYESSNYYDASTVRNKRSPSAHPGPPNLRAAGSKWHLDR